MPGGPPGCENDAMYFDRQGEKRCSIAQVRGDGDAAGGIGRGLGLLFHFLLVMFGNDLVGDFSRHFFIVIEFSCV